MQAKAAFSQGFSAALTIPDRHQPTKNDQPQMNANKRK